MGLAGGIDLGGTKIEAQLFDPVDGWRRVAAETRPTPRGDYDALIGALAGAAHWLMAGGAATIGLGAPGRVPPDGPAFMANLAANGRPLAADLRKAVGRPLAIVNDAGAFALSEARLGAGRGAGTVLGLIVGTGVSAGLVRDGVPIRGATGQAGEIGHLPIAHGPVLRHGLPWLGCGCGRTGCYETLCSGPGIARLAEHLTGAARSPADLAEDPAAAPVLAAWQDMMASLLASAAFAYDPAVIVLGGGVSRMAGVAERLSAALSAEMPKGAPLPAIRLAEGGDRSGARGAALYALDEAGRPG